MIPRYEGTVTSNTPKEVQAIDAAGAAQNIYTEEEIRAAGYSLMKTVDSSPQGFNFKGGKLTFWGVPEGMLLLLFIYTGVHYHYGAMVRKKDELLN